MATEQTKHIKNFYGGITRDDKSKINGVASNIEELDIFSNADYVQCEQIFSADTPTTGTEAYAYASDYNDVVYAYGKKASDGKVRIMKATTGGAATPGSWSDVFTSADATNLAYAPSPIQYFKTTEVNPHYLYFLTNASNTIKLCRFEISAGSDFTVVGTLTGLTGSYDKLSMKVLFGELFIMNGNLIAKVDKDGVFTPAAFTLPKEWIAVDMVSVSDVAIILGQHIDRMSNFSRGFWWDLTVLTQVDDSFDIPCGGPQWIVNHKETIKIMCAINGVARWFQLSGAFPGAVPLELPGMVMTNIATETSSQTISAPKMVAVKDKILYFGMWKTDKTGVYAIGQLDSDKPVALILSKRFATTDYSLHKPTALFILGPNYYGAYVDNTTASIVRCATLNSPNRSSSGVYESIVIDLGDATVNKDLKNVFIQTQPLPASTDINVFTAKDYGSYTEQFRPDGTSMNTTSGVLGFFGVTNCTSSKSFKIKTQMVSNGTSSPKLTGISFQYHIQTQPAGK